MDNPHDCSNSCIPPALPPSVDPSLVDFREFYPYIPNEIKHRKRTTQAQLEVLEQTFAHDKKPNGVMRANLARQLDMTPRGVQASLPILTFSHTILTCLSPQIHRFGSKTGVPSLHIPSSMSIGAHPLMQEGERKDFGKEGCRQTSPTPTSTSRLS